MPPGDRPFFLRGDPLDIWGYATSNAGKLYIVFRGTQFTSGLDFAQEWAEDAASLPLKPMGAGKVHLGFYGAYQALRQAVLENVSTVTLGKTMKLGSLDIPGGTQRIEVEVVAEAVK